MRGLFDRWAREERPTVLLGVARVALALLLVKNALRQLHELERDGYFGSYFHFPALPAAWVPSALGYEVLLWIKGGLALAAALGVMPRAALGFAASVGLYLIACDRLHYHNNHYATHLIALLVSWSPCGDSFNLWYRLRRIERPRLGPYWAVRLAHIQISIVYLASGVGKLFDPDWRGGRVMQLRFTSGARHASEPVAEVLRSAWFGELASKLAIATEIGVALGLWFPRSRPFALYMGMLFHLGIQASARVDLFSWLMLCSYLLFVTPELRERTLVYDPRSPRGRTIATAVRMLDWFARFRVRPAGQAAAPLEVVDRAGVRHFGFAAWVELFRALPALFPLWLPAWLLRLASARRAPRAGSSQGHDAAVPQPGEYSDPAAPGG